MIKLEMRGRTHDEARVISAQFTVEEDFETLRDALVAAMDAECGWAEENDVIIGHLKAYIRRGDDAVMLSTTGYGVQVKGTPGEGAELEVGIDSISYGSTLSVAEQRLEALARGLLAGRDVEVNWDCGDENCTDPHHHHHHHSHGAHAVKLVPVKAAKKPLKVHPKPVYPGHIGS